MGTISTRLDPWASVAQKLFPGRARRVSQGSTGRNQDRTKRQGYGSQSCRSRQDVLRESRPTTHALLYETMTDSIHQLMMLYPLSPPPNFAFSVVEVMSSSKYHLKRRLGSIAQQRAHRADGFLPCRRAGLCGSTNGVFVRYRRGRTHREWNQKGDFKDRVWHDTGAYLIPDLTSSRICWLLHLTYHHSP